MRQIGLEWLHRVALEPRRLFGRYAHDACYFAPLLGRELYRSRVLPRFAASVDTDKGGNNHA
jgi:hypothetical protein